MPRGRKPKPTVLHQLQGTLHATRHAARLEEPMVFGSLTAAPTWLSASQKDGWDYVMAHAPLNVLKCIDRTVLALWVAAEDQHRSAVIAQNKLDASSKLPLLTKGKDGVPVVSPYLGVMNRAAAVLLKCASELGFSPAARPRLSGALEDPVPGAKHDPWARLKVLQGGKGSSAT